MKQMPSDMKHIILPNMNMKLYSCSAAHLHFAKYCGSRFDGRW